MAQRLIADFPLQELAKETGFRERTAPAGWRALYARGVIRARESDFDRSVELVIRGVLLPTPHKHTLQGGNLARQLSFASNPEISSRSCRSNIEILIE